MKISSEIASKIVTVNKVLRRELGEDIRAEIVVSFCDVTDLELELSAGGGTDFIHCKIPFALFESDVQELTSYMIDKATDLLVAMGGEY